MIRSPRAWVLEQNDRRIVFATGPEATMFAESRPFRVAQHRLPAWKAVLPIGGHAELLQPGRPLVAAPGLIVPPQLAHSCTATSPYLALFIDSWLLPRARGRYGSVPARSAACSPHLAPPIPTDPAPAWTWAPDTPNCGHSPGARPGSIRESPTLSTCVRCAIRTCPSPPSPPKSVCRLHGCALWSGRTWASPLRACAGGADCVRRSPACRSRRPLWPQPPQASPTRPTSPVRHGTSPDGRPPPCDALKLKVRPDGPARRRSRAGPPPEFSRAVAGADARTSRSYQCRCPPDGRACRRLRVRPSYRSRCR